MNLFTPRSRFGATALQSHLRFLFLLLLLAGLPIFIWAVMTQRIELRKKAATSEGPVVCWNRVIGQAGNYQWPNGCKGDPSPAWVCTEALVSLTATETYNYLQWVNAGKPYIPGCTTTTPTPTPPSSSWKKINWTTPYAYLRADDMQINAGGKVFKGTPDSLTPVSVHSDPGNENYTTLEMIWKEQGAEMRLFIYFNALCTKSLPPQCRWNISEIRTYNGNNPGDWIYYKSKLAENPISGQYAYGWGTNQYSITSDPPTPGSIIFTNLEIGAFMNRLTPSPTVSSNTCQYARNGAPCTTQSCKVTDCSSGTCFTRYTVGGTCPTVSGTCQNGQCIVQPPPTPTCMPRPACLDANPACLMKIMPGSWYCPATPTPALSCGGITGKACPSGYICQYSSGTTRAPYPDASGQCVPLSKTYTCTTLSTTQSSYFNQCRNAGFAAVCFNKYTGVYQGCTSTSTSNDCTVNNTNATSNMFCPIGSVTPSPTCVPKPSCMNPPPGQPACMIKLAEGGWFCPTTPTPTPGSTSCIRNAPASTLTPKSQSAAAGTSLTYLYTISNTDSSTCGITTFTLNTQQSNGWLSSLGANTIALKPGQTTNISVKFVASKTATAQSYPVSVYAKSPLSTKHYTTATAAFQVTGTTTTIAGDLNGDKTVNLLDYNFLLNNYGKTGSPGFTTADMNRDGKVDLLDYNQFLTFFK